MVPSRNQAKYKYGKITLEKNKQNVYIMSNLLYIKLVTDTDFAVTLIKNIIILFGESTSRSY